MEEFLRDEKYYGVFDYDDELTPGIKNRAYSCA